MSATSSNGNQFKDLDKIIRSLVTQKRGQKHSLITKFIEESYSNNSELLEKLFDSNDIAAIKMEQSSQDTS